MDHRNSVLQRVFRVFEIHVLAIEQYIAFIHAINAKKALHHRALSCAVFAHQAKDGAFFDLEVDVMENAVFSETLREMANLQDVRFISVHRVSF